MKHLPKFVTSILRFIGYYSIKAKWRHHHTYKQWQKEDKVRREHVMQQIFSLSGRVLPPINDNANITVSLTSHGKRIADYAYCAIYSMLNQSLKPNRIVLNIDKNSWNQDSLPSVLIKLQELGLEVNFCEDIGPHTKFIPTLQKYPDDVIITIDDDIMYGVDTIKLLWDEYLVSNKQTIICHQACAICRDENGKLLSYSQWGSNVVELNQKAAVGVWSPYGYRGILYPPHIFSDEIFNANVYRKLCPKADDIWFTVMELRDKISVKSIEHRDSSFIDVDRQNEYTSTNSDALHFQNVGNGQNDIQLDALKDYYNL